MKPTDTTNVNEPETAELRDASTLSNATNDNTSQPNAEFKRRVPTKLLLILCLCAVYAALFCLFGNKPRVRAEKSDEFSSGVLSTPDENVPYQVEIDENGVCVIPDGIKYIGGKTLKNCAELRALTIPEGVVEIYGEAFAGCSALRSVTIPASVTRIDNNAFCGCEHIVFDVSPKNRRLCSVDGVLLTKDRRILVRSRVNDDGLGIVPSCVTKIESCAFKNCVSLTNVKIPSGVIDIGRGAFAGCSSLTSATIPDGVRTIELATFADCSSLSSIEIPSGLNLIERSAFANCSSLRDVTIPKTVLTIGTTAFKSCSSLERVTFLGNDVIIGVNAFEGCSALTNVTIPPRLSEIMIGAFRRCSSLRNVTIQSDATTVGERAFAECSKELTIYGKPNSFAETYAKTNEIAFVADEPALHTVEP